MWAVCVLFSRGAVEKLLHLTEGWAAGVVLAGMATRWMDPAAMDDGGDQIERVVSGVIPVEGITARCDDILFQGSRGVGLEDGSDPQIQMRYSDTSGHAWVDWRARSLGKIGDYRRKAVWRRLGTMRSPGRLVEFRVTDPVQAVFAGFAINEARP